MQARHQLLLDADTAETNFKSKLNDAYVNAKTTLPGNQWKQSVTDSAAQLQQQMLDDPANAHIKNFLGTRLPQLTAVVADDANVSGALQTAKDQHDQKKLIGQQLANTAGADFAVAPDGTVQDGPTAQAARAKYQSLTNSFWAKNPDAARNDMQEFEQQVIQQRAQSIAQKGPASQPMLLDRYVAAHGENFDPAQLEHLYNMRTAAVEAPYKASEAAHKSIVAQKIGALDQAASTHDPNLAALAGAARQGGWIDDQQYRNYTNTKWRDPGNTSDPAVVSAYTNGIGDRPFAYSPADIEAIDKDSISPNDRAKLKAQLYDTQHAAKQTIGAEYYNSRELIKEAMAPGIVNVNPEATRLRSEAALSDLETPYKDGHFEKAQDVIDMRNKIIQNYTKGRPTRAPIPHVAPETLTAAQIKSLADEAREPASPEAARQEAPNDCKGQRRKHTVDACLSSRTGCGYDT